MHACAASSCCRRRPLVPAATCPPALARPALFVPLAFAIPTAMQASAASCAGRVQLGRLASACARSLATRACSATSSGQTQMPRQLSSLGGQCGGLGGAARRGGASALRAPGARGFRTSTITMGLKTGIVGLPKCVGKGRGVPPPLLPAAAAAACRRRRCCRLALAVWRLANNSPQNQHVPYPLQCRQGALERARWCAAAGTDRSSPQPLPPPVPTPPAAAAARCLPHVLRVCGAQPAPACLPAPVLDE